jgi:hypothetical protein
MAEPARAVAPARCAGCSTELPPARLDCPACRRLVHAETLRALAARGAAAEASGDAAAALAAWREAHALVPAGTRQHETVAAPVARLSTVAPAIAPPPPSWVGRLGPLAAFGLLLWKVIGPIWQLDGSRGLASLARWERFALLGVAIAALLASREQMLCGCS